MTKDNFPKWLIDLGLVSVLVFIDQIIKFAFSTWFSEGDTKEIIKGFFSFELVFNQGAVFGITIDKILLITGTVLILAALVFIYFKRLVNREYLQRLGIVLIVAGALSNFWDRIFWGHVVDWLKLSFWPAFNFADLLIVAGIFLLGWALLFQRRSG